ncbi:MAG: SDR family oxidoreductase [Pseudomonadota bacterium]
MTETRREYGLTQDALRDAASIFSDDLLKDKVVLVSGGGSGIGQAISWAMAKAGAKVFICGRKQEKLRETTEALKVAGLSAASHVCNIRNTDEVDALFGKAESAFGGVDILVNCAGGQFPQPAIDFSENGWRAVIETNLNGTWFMTQAAAKRWVSRSHAGVVINIVAVVDRGMPGVAHTCAARAGVIGLTKTLALEWAPHDIRLNCIAPGTIETMGLNVYPEHVVKAFDDANAQRRMGSVLDISNACVFLASPGSTFTTGETLTIDGGGKLWGELWLAGKPEHFR